MLNMDTLSVLRQPVATEMAEYQALFQAALATDDVYLGQALAYVGRRSGKMMRPLLVLLMAKEFGRVGQKALYSAVSLELLHTASLVHDDVVDDSAERRGQRSVNAVYDNKVAVLVGDYLLSVCLLHSALTSDHRMVEIIARLGATLSKGEIDQLAHARGEAISEKFTFTSFSTKRLRSLLPVPNSVPCRWMPAANKWPMHAVLAKSSVRVSKFATTSSIISPMPTLANPPITT